MKKQQQVLEMKKVSNKNPDIESFIHLNFLDIQYREAKGIAIEKAKKVVHHGVICVAETKKEIKCAFMAQQDISIKEMLKTLNEKKNERVDYIFIVMQNLKREVTLGRFARTANISIEFRDDFKKNVTKYREKKSSTR